MIPRNLSLEIVTPDRALVRDTVDEVEIPGSDGYFGVLPGHTPLLATLQVGQLWYRKGQEKVYLAVAFGFAEVLPDRVTILAQVAERAEDIDVAPGGGRPAARAGTSGPLLGGGRFRPCAHRVIEGGGPLAGCREGKGSRHLRRSS
jgi:F-type H+-transporting ATPase subunit epsilon